MTAAHWLVPPPPSPMGSRPLPGVPAVGHTLDPRHCPACGTAAPATAREVKVPAPAPTPRVVPPPPPPAPPRPARKPQAPRCDTIVAADDVREGLRTLTQRFGRRVAAQVVGVSQDSVRRVIDGERVQIDVVETVRVALLRVDGAPSGAVESLTAAEVAALRDRIAREGERTVLGAAGVTPVVLHRALAGLRPGVTGITRLREYVRVATAHAAGTVREKILVAALDLATRGGPELLPFDDADLVVRAWQLFPESFSMRGHAHPDSNRVLAKLPGPEGLVGRGYLRRVSTSTYALTPQGVAQARSLAPRRAA